MARYVIGDIQGCYLSFMELLKKIDFNPGKDELYLVGDLVNRGPDSLKVLRFVYANSDNIVTVLGNHDIYLMARYCGIRPPDKDETIQDILLASDSHKLIDWIRSCPLIYQDEDNIIVHAGVYPKMDFNHLLFLCNNVSDHLQSKSYAEFIDNMYGNKPNYWDNELLDLYQQMKFAVNSCTRMRYLNVNDNTLDYKYKGEVINKGDKLVPWFLVDFHASINKTIIFGHWASLGYYKDEKGICLDTGCVYGRMLTAMNLDTREIIQVLAQK